MLPDHQADFAVGDLARSIFRRMTSISIPLDHGVDRLCHRRTSNSLPIGFGILRHCLRPLPMVSARRFDGCGDWFADAMRSARTGDSVPAGSLLRSRHAAIEKVASGSTLAPKCLV